MGLRRSGQGPEKPAESHSPESPECRWCQGPHAQPQPGPSFPGPVVAIYTRVSGSRSAIHVLPGKRAQPSSKYSHEVSLRDEQHSESVPRLGIVVPETSTLGCLKSWTVVAPVREDAGKKGQIQVSYRIAPLLQEPLH